MGSRSRGPDKDGFFLFLFYFYFFWIWKWKRRGKKGPIFDVILQQTPTIKPMIPFFVACCFSPSWLYLRFFMVVASIASEQEEILFRFDSFFFSFYFFFPLLFLFNDSKTHWWSYFGKTVSLGRPISIVSLSLSSLRRRNQCWNNNNKGDEGNSPSSSSGRNRVCKSFIHDVVKLLLLQSGFFFSFWTFIAPWLNWNFHSNFEPFSFFFNQLVLAQFVKLLWFFSIKENCWFDRNNLVWWGGGNIRSIIKGSWWLLTNHLFVSFIVCHFCAAFWWGDI